MNFIAVQTSPDDTAVAQCPSAEPSPRRGAWQRPLLRDGRNSPGQESPTSDELIRRTVAWLQAEQAADGHWRAPLEGDTILESEYVLLLAWADRLDGPHVPGCARRILNEQLPEGGWAIYPGGPVDVSASVKAYLALKLTGHDPSSADMRRARQAIKRAGGPWAVNSFTKFYLALFGQIPYAACPAVPPEAVLLPDWFPVNLYRVSAWSRTMIVPLSLMWAFKPLRKVPADRGIAELFAAADRSAAPPIDTGGWARFFRGVDRCMKACESFGLTPLRARAVQACRRWMLARFHDSDGLGAIFPPIVWSYIGLRAMGCSEDAPEVRECWEQLDRLVEAEPDGARRLEPCRSPVWDTAISLIAIVEGSSAARRLAADQGIPNQGGADDTCITTAERAIDWLLDHEIRAAGDWARRVVAEPSGWCFEYANRFYPDVDDTAMVVIALATWRDRVGRQTADPRVAPVGESIARACRWLEAMQNSDGGWGAFDRDNNVEFLCKVPFADHNAMIDPSSPDLAGRVLEAFGKTGLRCGHPCVDRALGYLRRTQEADGSWYGRWGVNYIYGTWQALVGLQAVGLPADDPMVTSAAAWLLIHQQADGGWGETPDSYADKSLAGVGAPTASQTAWALCGLIAAGRGDSRAVHRGVQWLAAHQHSDGTWSQREFTGTGFPKVFYLHYHWYAIYFPLIALARARGCGAVEEEA